MTNNENEFEYEGEVYVAVDAKIVEPGLFSCEGCDLVYGSDGCFLAPYCTSNQRKDNRNVIFKEKV